MRCDPATLSDVLVQLGGRLEHQSPAQAEQLRKALESIGSLQSNAAWSEQFWPRLTERLTGTAPGLMLQPIQAGRPPEAPAMEISICWKRSPMRCELRWPRSEH